MCGIIGYIGKKKNALPVLVNGLKCLEYRGYDSAGVCYLDGDKYKVVKSTGIIANLEEKLDLDVKSYIGIGHTRWATHGKANETNCHPHVAGAITLVHNGIIENYTEIKNELSKKGVKFYSDTDTEVAAALLNHLYSESKDVIKTIQEFKERARGSYAIVFVIDGDFEHVYVIRNLSPLIIGIGDGENYIASDVPAILKETSKYVMLEDGEFAVIMSDGVLLYDKNGKKKDIKVRTFQGDATSIDKGEYEHFMLKEIHEEPNIVRHLLAKYSDVDELKGLPDFCKYESITIVACGSAMHAGLVGKYFIEKNLGIPVTVKVASEFRYDKLFLSDKDAVIAISQSGETADTLAAVKISKKMGAHTIGIVNVKESSIAREVDEVVYTLAGSEIAVATTKAYISQLVVLFLISIRNRKDDKLFEKLDNVAFIMDKLINETSLYEKIAEEIKSKEDIFFIGRQIDYAICMEGSLKLKEISYIHSDAYAAGELKHGTISLISDGTPVFALITDANIAEKTISNIKEVKARGANVILVISESLDLEGDFYDEKIVIPECYDLMAPILSVVPLQLIAYYVAKLRGCSIDKPRNLAKSVTVE